jgi:hypothetical protein
MSLQGQKEAMKKRMLAAPIIRKQDIKVKDEPGAKELTVKQSTQAAPVLYSQSTTTTAMQLFEVIKALKVTNFWLTGLGPWKTTGPSRNYKQSRHRYISKCGFNNCSKK